MAPVSKMLFLPTALLALLSEVALANQAPPIAVKKQLPDANEKLFPEHLAFAPLPRLTPLEAAAAAHQWVEDLDTDTDTSHATSKRHVPAFALHHDDSEESILRRAAEALALLQRRTSCPVAEHIAPLCRIQMLDKWPAALMERRAEEELAVVLLAPQAVRRNLVVDAASLDTSAKVMGVREVSFMVIKVAKANQELGVPSASATVTASTVVTSVPAPSTQTITTTHTTIVEGNPSTVVVTLTVTQTAIPDPTTKTTTKVVTAGPGSGSATGVPPWRPTAVTSTQEVSTLPGDTQTGCPTGFYGCLATHGGGCCRTERDCQTLSCPPLSSTIISHGVTIVVPASDVPASATSTCASGWFMCGADAGPVAGCCPSGYECGTASCFTVQATQTSKVQKEAPAKNAAAGGAHIQGLVLGGMIGSWVFAWLI
ncbi:hypothetical protein PT974_11392 [Cladobotryum mycophilum]|uniref:GPI anchored protein n=1 Tax=Cladobotryum mycophilum TaxID=491253 RepID=A0ABR0S554_9HYPO